MADADFDDELLNDLLVLSTLPIETLTKLGDEIEAHAAFIPVPGLVVSYFKEKGDALAVSKLTANLDPDSVDESIEWVLALREADEVVRAQWTDDAVANLRQNLPALIRKSPAMVRTRKANALRIATGNEINGLQFICDARPVYNEKRDAIDGYIALATMKIIFERPNTQDDVIEFVLSPDEIDSLIEAAQSAKAKLSVLDATFSKFLSNGNGEST